ncbi:Hsp20/alpha crystallin family protein [Microbacterium caowuchunii]|uniref:Hsp20/alpha crystallin family protein n=1 Tax=Microbacterium caowuchunii TaxID=2614638 RepID=A0A5N0TPW7_9MICO|nr:Hsp20/alpha crystallin family protein [Microbacterium caowuchunii]KAA9135946.1 Hsp20/alpha crystallin family protein [Microbacterium caowuchunii]
MHRNPYPAAAPLLLHAVPRELETDGADPDSTTRSPTTDIYVEPDGALIIETHLPQFAEPDVTVTVGGGGLVIEAELPDADAATREYVLRESAAGFEHAITLPEGFDVGRMSDSFVCGVLRVRVPLTDASAGVMETPV